MPNYRPDLTGEAPGNYLDTYQRMVWKGNQKLIFDVPVFNNEHLEIILIGGVPAALQPGTDWVVNQDDVDVDAIAFCKSIDDTFSHTLVKSVTVIRPFISDYSIQCKFNQLFADEIKYTRLHSASDTIEVTPTLVSNIVEQVDYLQQMVLNASEAYSKQSGFARTLSIDRNGDLPDNKVVSEIHDINTINDISFINLIYGAFYGDSLVIQNTLTGIPLSESGYRVLEVDLAKTRNSSSPSGVYRSIEITQEYVGEVSVTYQAYGGVTDIASIGSLRDKLVTLESFLSSNSFITPGTLHAEPSIINLYNKIASMEGDMRLLLQNGLPNYGDVSTNSSVLKKLVAADDVLHWWSLATLYRVDGSEENITADVFKFRLKSMYTKLMFECSVAVNVDPTYTGNSVQVTCLNDSVPGDILSNIAPALRIIEVNNNGVFPGIILQLGMRLGAGILQETIAIEDMSGKESCWKLVPFSPSSINPEDTSVVMPDGLTVYTDSAVDATATIETIPFITPLDIVLPGLNDAIAITGFEQSDLVNDESDLIIQSITALDWSTMQQMMYEFVVNIGSNSTRLSVTLPVTSRIVTEEFIMFRTEVQIGATQFKVTCMMANLIDVGCTLRTVVRAISPEVFATTLNLVNVKVVLVR